MDKFQITQFSTNPLTETVSISLSTTDAQNHATLVFKSTATGKEGVIAAANEFMDKVRQALQTA